MARTGKHWIGSYRPARRRWWHGPVRRCITGLTAGVFLGGITVATVAVSLVASAPPASAAGCSSASSLIPTVHTDSFAPSSSQQFMINQGLPVYSNSSTDTSTNLVRGKDTLLRLFLSLPSCASRQSITVSSATASVNNGSTTVSGIKPFSPTGSFSLPAYYTGTPPANLPTDPIFVVPGADLAPTNTTAAFSAAFTITLTYTNSLAPTTAVTSTFTGTAKVAQKSNALRILVVPMGSGTQITSSQYSSSASAAVDQAMNTLSRIYPVPCDANPSDSTSSCYSNSIASAYGGIRYSVNATMLDLTTIVGTFDSKVKFCGGQTNWNAIASVLSTMLQSYNTNNANPADRVVGVVDQAISDGTADSTSPSGFSCADGMSSPGSNAAWARAIYTLQPSSTGGVIAMELEHTFGGVPYPRSTTYHSLNSAADGTAPTRAYNVTQRAQIGTSRSVMKYDLSSPWNNNTTVQEQLDDQFVLCNLGGPTDPECTTTGTTGTTNGVAAGQDTFVMSGSTQNTMATTQVVMSYYAGNNQPTSPDPQAALPSSSYRLVQSTLDGSSIVNNVGVSTSIADSAHSSTSNNQALTPTSFNFSIAVPGFTGVGRIDFYWCGSTPSSACQADPAHNGGTLLYERIQQSSPPTVTSVSSTGAGGITDYSNNPSVDDTNPAIHGNAVAWVAPCSACSTRVTTIHLAPTSSASQAPEIPLTADGSAQGDPAWKPDGTALVFDAGGNLYTAAVNTGTQPFTVGSPVLIWSKGQANADTPTWSADGVTVYFHSSAGGLDSVSSANCGSGGCKGSPVVSSPSHERAPSASPTDKRSLSYIGDTSTGPALFILDPTAAKPGATSRQIAANAGQPFFGDNGRVTFTSTDTTKPGLWSVNAADGSGPTQLTSNASDANSSESNGALAFDRPFPTATSHREIMLANLSTDTVTANVSSSSPSLLSGELDVKCPSGEVFPVKVGVPPTSTTSTAAQFNASFDGTEACSGTLTLSFRASDGFTLSTPSATSQVQVTNASQPPVAAITAPATGAAFSGASTIPLNGGGSSLQDGWLTGSSLKWFAGSTQVGTGNVVDAAPPQGGWPTGPLTITLQATDSSGRVATATRQVIINSTPPSVTITSSPANPTSSTSASFGFTASGSDLQTVLCQLDAGALTPCTSSANYTGLTDGSHTFLVYAIDSAGNTATGSYIWVVDTTPPTTTATVSPAPTSSGWNNSSVTVTLTATDTGSGVKQITYSLSGAQTGGPTTVAGSTTSFTVSNTGTTTVSYSATDNVGNVESTKTLQVKIDETGPTLTIDSVIPTNTGEGITGTATDDRSGVASVTVTFVSNVTKKTVTETATCSPPCGPGAGVSPALPVRWQAPVPPPTTKNGQTDNFKVSATGTDVAGNTGTAATFPTPVVPI